MVESVAASATTPKKSKAPKTKKPKAVASHPPVSKMVNSAISALKERGGSSLVAIKKYISANYKVDADKVSTYIKKYIKSSIASGALVQTKGKGVGGSFKLGGAEKSVAKPKKSAAVKASKPKKAKTDSPKKAAKPKKAAAPKPKKSPAKKAKPAKKAASPKKPAAVKLAAKPKKAKASPKKKAAAKKGKK